MRSDYLGSSNQPAAASPFEARPGRVSRPDSRSLAVIKPDEGRLTTINIETGQELSAPTWDRPCSKRASRFPGWQRHHYGVGKRAEVLRRANGPRASLPARGTRAVSGRSVNTPKRQHASLPPAGDGTIAQLGHRASDRELRVSHRSGPLASARDFTETARKSPPRQCRLPRRPFESGTSKPARLLQECLRKTDLDASAALSFSSDGKELLFYSHKHGLKTIDVATGQERAAVQPQFLLTRKDAFQSDLSHTARSLRRISTSPTCTGAMTHVVELASGVERFSCPSYTMAFTPTAMDWPSRPRLTRMPRRRRSRKHRCGRAD